MDGKRIWQQGRHWLAGLMVVALAACGGSGGGSTYTPAATPTPTAPPYISTAVVSTLVGAAPGTDGTGASARFALLRGSVVIGGNLYMADSWNHTIRKMVIATGVVTTFAGTAYARGSSDGTGAAARFNNPKGITSDGSNLYVTDYGSNIIRKIVIATGAVTTLAGTASRYDSTDGTGAAAGFNQPWGITSDGTNLYVADYGNQTIRKIVIASGVVTTLAGTAGNSGNSDGTGTAARFSYLEGITNDGTNLYVADSQNGTIRKIVIATGVVTTLAGTANTNGSTDGTGAAARFYFPEGIVCDGNNLYVADTYNNTIRKIVIATGVVTTLAGTANANGSTDGTGAAARFGSLSDISSDGSNLYVSDGAILRKAVINTGAVSTPAGSLSVDGTGAQAGLGRPAQSVVVGGNLYVADAENHTIRKIVIATGVVTTLAGTAGGSGRADGTGAAARFDHPQSIVSDGSNLYVADTQNHAIRKIVVATGLVTTLAGTAGSSGLTDGTGAAARFDHPQSIVSDGGNLYVADTWNNSIRKIVIATGVVTTVAGYSLGSTDGVGAAASFKYPGGISSDGSALYVMDTDNNTIRKITSY